MFKKGFTLLELLAVIVVLTIIAFITTPIVLSSIEMAQTNSIKSSAYGYIDSIEYYTAVVTSDDSTSNDIPITGSFDFLANKDDIVTSGSKPIRADIILENGKVVSGSLTFNNHLVTIDSGQIIEISSGEKVVYSTASKIYGVSFNGTTGTRTDNSIGLSYTVNASTINSDFDNAEIYNEITEVIDKNGNFFVKIPKFYIKKTKTGANFTYKISKTKPDDSYYLPYSFYDEETDTVLPYVLIGKYTANMGTSISRLESKPNQIPYVRNTINNFRIYTGNNNTFNNNGYQLIDIHAIDILQTLFYVEFATLDSQSIMKGYTAGRYIVTDTITAINGFNLTLNPGIAANFNVGQMIDIGTSLGGRQIASNLRITNIVGDIITYEEVPNISSIIGTIANGNIVYTTGYISGTTDVVQTSSGSPVSNTDGKNTMKYRGIENLYGNLYQIIDGINIKDYQAYVATNSNLYESNIFNGAYKMIGYVSSSINGLTTEMGYDSLNPFIQLPTSVGTDVYKDFYVQAASDRISLFGGYFANTSSAGITNWNNSYLSASVHISFSSRIIKKAL